jgi:hypothetical protein
MAINTRVNGLTTRGTGRASTHGLMALNTRVNGLTTRGTGRASTHGLMARNTRVNGLTTRRTGRASTHGLMALNTRVNGLTTICTGRASTHGLMAENIRVQHVIFTSKVTMSKTRRKDTVSYSGLMDGCTEVNGRTGRSTARERSPKRMANRLSPNGPREYK